MRSLPAKIIICCITTTTLGLLSGLMTYPEIPGWYATLKKPDWNPPNGVFGPVWTTLYILMGMAAALVWHKGGRSFRAALYLFGIQFTLNLLWSYIFFNQHQLKIAFAEIIALWITILVNIIMFYRIHKIAGLLLMPYLAWVSFAAVLNYTIMQLNS